MLNIEILCHIMPQFHHSRPDVCGASHCPLLPQDPQIVNCYAQHCLFWLCDKLEMFLQSGGLLGGLQALLLRVLLAFFTT